MQDCTIVIKVTQFASSIGSRKCLTCKTYSHASLHDSSRKHCLTFQISKLPLPEPAATCCSAGDRQAVHQIVPALNCGALKVCRTSNVCGSTAFSMLSFPHVSTVPTNGQKLLARNWLKRLKMYIETCCVNQQALVWALGM